MKNNINRLLYNDAIENIKKDLLIANNDWDYLSSTTGNGPIAEFEKRFGSIAGGKYTIALNSCTSAIFVALLSSGVGQGDEVILPSYTWPQTLTPVILTGATPVFADIGKHSLTLDPVSVKRLISKKTKAIIGVHIYGFPADVIELENISKENKCILIYDSAQAFGSIVNEKPIGAFGDFVAFSFGRSKLFSIGDGGALVCRNKDLYENSIAVSQHPLRMHRDIDNVKKRNLIDGVSMNLRMHPLIASLARGQLEGLIRSKICEELRNEFFKLKELISSIGLSHLIPLTREGTLPSGVCFPLISATKKDIDKIIRYKDKLEINIYENSTIKPLHLTPTIMIHRFLPFNKNSSFHIPSHKTHKYGSCPNTEKRCEESLFFLRLKEPNRYNNKEKTIILG